MLAASLLGVAVVAVVAVTSPRGRAKGWDIQELKSERLTQRSFFSDALKQRRRYVVYVPPGYSADPSRRYPVIYLLHGLGGRGANWFEPSKGALFQQLDALILAKVIPPVVAVAPDGGAGYWTDHLGASNRRFGRFVSHDLVRHVDLHSRTLADRKHRAVVGASMGGHGALSVALMNPDRFGAAASIAGALFPRAPTHRKVYHRVWGHPPDPAHWRATSPIALIKAIPVATPAKAVPRIYLSCGTQDGLGFAEYARKASRMLTRRKVDHRLTMVPGGRHGWQMFGPDAARWLPWVTSPWRATGGDDPTKRRPSATGR